jgi:hypothetical protein
MIFTVLRELGHQISVGLDEDSRDLGLDVVPLAPVNEACQDVIPSAHQLIDFNKEPRLDIWENLLLNFTTQI